MQKATGKSKRSRSVSRACTSMGAAVAAIACLGIGAAPAYAGNEFEDGFEDQMGRLLAFEAFNVGRFILSGGHAGHGHYTYRSLSRHPHRDGPRHYRRHKRHHRGHQHKSYWRRHHGHDHGYRASCGVETTHRVRRDRHGEVVEYERRERRRDRHDDDHHYARW